jgi:hypothetical protein
MKCLTRTTNLPNGCICKCWNNWPRQAPASPPSCPSLVSQSPKGSVHLNSHANAAAERDLLRRAFAPFFCQSAVQPGTSCHMTWRGKEAGSYQEGQESRLFPFVDLNGGVLNFRCWIDKLSWALANQSPLPPRTLVEVCMKGPSLLGFFSFVLGSGRVRRPHIQGEKRVVVLVLTTCRWTWLDQIT